ncbi:MAG: hypothetical protein ACJKTH_00145 [Patescibacteria group bacterium UBA2163]
MLFFLDFDRTLFNTEAFYNALEADFILGTQNVTLSDLSPFLYDDVSGFLAAWKKAGHELVVVTRGVEEVQKAKLENTRLISRITEALYVTEGGKSEAIRRYLAQHSENTPAVFADDSLNELADVRDNVPGVQVVRMRRPTAKNAGEEAPEFIAVQNLFELEKVALKT